MFARLVSGQIRIDKLEEAIRIWKWNDVPLLISGMGYRGAYFFVDRRTGKAISITLWDSEKEAVADERSAQHQKQLDMYKGLFAGKPTSQRYEVSAQDKI